MSYSISENYSSLNNNSYDNKSLLISTLDFLSAPARKVLGGRNIYVISQTYEHPTSIPVRVAFVAAMYFFQPLLFISCGSLILKIAIGHLFWEKRQVQNQTKEIWKGYNEFDQFFLSQQYNKAIDVIVQHPQLLDLDARSDVKIQGKLFTMINVKINHRASWSEIQSPLRLLFIPDASKLIKHAVQIRLGDEVQKNCYRTTARDILELIQGAIRPASSENYEVVIKKILSETLKTDFSSPEPFIPSLVKTEIADKLIQSLTGYKIANAKDEIDKTWTQFDETKLRDLIFDQNAPQLLRDGFKARDENIKEIFTAVQILRNFHTTGQNHKQFLNTLTISTLTDLTPFKDVLNEWLPLLDPNEKELLKAFQDYLDTLIQSSPDMLQKNLQDAFDSYKKAAITYNERIPSPEGINASEGPLFLLKVNQKCEFLKIIATLKENLDIKIQDLLTK